MANTNGDEVIESFESNFADKEELPVTLEHMWLKKAIARYSIELDPLTFDEETNEFDAEISPYAIDTLANFMWQIYQERQVSKVNKRASIVGKDLSYDGTGNTKRYNKEELDYIAIKSEEMINNQVTPAYN